MGCRTVRAFAKFELGCEGARKPVPLCRSCLRFLICPHLTVSKTFATQLTPAQPPGFHVLADTRPQPISITFDACALIKRRFNRFEINR